MKLDQTYQDISLDNTYQAHPQLQRSAGAISYGGMVAMKMLPTEG